MNPRIYKLLTLIRDLFTILFCCLIAAAIFAVPLGFVITWRNPVEPEVFLCFGLNSTQKEVCLGRGNCTALNVCNCTTGYVGSTCQLSLCFGLNTTNPLVCSGKGVCIAPNTCQCTGNSTGQRCEL